MKKYQIAFLPEAAAELVALDKTVAKRVWKKIEWAAEHFEHLTPERLVGELRGLFKLRIGAYRVGSQGSRTISTQLSAVRGDIRHSVLSSAKAEKVLELHVETRLDEGSRATVEWLKEQLTSDSEER